MLNKIKEYYITKGFEEIPKEHFETPIDNTNEEFLSALRNKDYMRFVDLKVEDRFGVVKDETMTNIFIDFNLDLNIPDNKEELIEINEFFNHFSLEEIKASIKREVLEGLNKFLYISLASIQEKYISKKMKSNSRLFVLVKNSELLNKEWIKEIEENKYFIQVSVIPYENKKDIIDYFTNIENKTIDNIKPCEFDLFFKLPPVNGKRNLYFKRIDLMKKDKTYADTVFPFHISDTFNKYKDIFNYFFNLYGIDSMDEVLVDINMEISLTNHIYIQRKLIYSLSILLTTMLNEDLDTIIYDFLPIEEFLIKSTILFKLFNKNIDIFQYERDNTSYIMYRLTKLGFKEKN